MPYETPATYAAAWNRRSQGTLHDLMGMTIEEVSRERVVISLIVGPQLHQPYGLMHGGVSLALAESAASIGGNVACADGKAALGQEINANHLRSVREGTVRAVATPVHIGRTSQVWSVEVRDGAGQLVCVSRCTLAIVDAPPGAPANPRA
jgi:uncharacterized protein (TIGR00369 family)